MDTSLRGKIGAFAALFVLFSCVAAATFASSALAVETDDLVFSDEAAAELSALQAQIESTAQDYDDALARIEELAGQIAENQARVEEINEELPVQRANAAEAFRALYVIQSEGYGLVSMLLGSGTLAEFLQSLEYMDAVQQHNQSQIEKLADMKAELEATLDQLDKDKAEADNAADRAQRALEQAKAARQEAQDRAIAEALAQIEAQRQAELAAQQAAAALAAARNAEADAQAAKATERAAAQQAQQAVAANAAEAGAAAGSDAGAEAAASAEAAAEAEAVSAAGVDSANTEAPVLSEDPEPQAEGTVAYGDVDWSVGRDAFIAQWSARIDAYLAGFPLAGQGVTFATAAWNYGVDPRWSPAISMAESTKGSFCFLPYNAWGWGSSSWNSWEEAIDAHVAGLARGYGATLTYAAATKYCPPNANHWYNTVLAQMNSI